ncbi:MAG: ABC transporter ATP-binding protein [Actinomycetota bacterium]|nr:ABC transporter ATP-binding protein [Actinomycetota bacterium]
MSLDKAQTRHRTQLLTGEKVLQVDDITVGYNGVAIVHDVSLELRAGSTACIVGPNGCGKSTLLKGLAGLVRPMSGTVELMDRGDITAMSTAERAASGIGYVPQIDDVFTPLTVEENITVGGYRLPRKKNAENRDRVLTLFPRLRSMLKRHAGVLSGGERKMLAMARVLMLEPTVLLLDEPTAGLTEEMASRLLDEQLAELKSSGIAVLLVEQRANLAMASADWAYVLAAGQVRRSGSAAELRADPSFSHIFLGGTEETFADAAPTKGDHRCS